MRDISERHKHEELIWQYAFYDQLTNLPNRRLFEAVLERAVSQKTQFNEAFAVLSCPLARAIYLLQLNGIDTKSETDTQMPADFLSEQIDLREALQEVSDEACREHIERKINAAWQQCEQGLIQSLDATPKEWVAARLWVRKMQFYARLREEVQLCLC